MKKYSVLFLVLFLFGCSVEKAPVETNTSVSSNLPQKITSTQTGTINNVETVEKVQGANVMPLYKMADSKDLVSLEKALEKEDKTNVDILKLYGKLRFEQKKYEEAIDYFNKANTAFDGNDADSVYMIGVCYSNLGDIEKAKEYNKKAGILDPKSTYIKEFQTVLDNWNIQNAK